MEESVSDSEVDFHSKTEEELPKRGTRRWAYAVRRVSIGWSPVHGADSLFNGGDTIVQPDRAVESLRSPSVQTYSNLKRRLLKFKSNPEWILHFLQNDGLEILFESLEQICQQKSSNFLDSVLQIGCIECVKTVMDSSLGLDYIVENPEFTRKFASALDTDNAAVKKQVFELLSALCVYSKEGYKRALDALEQYRNNKKLRFRFSVILDELRTNDNLGYKITLLEFINCVIIYTEKIEDRVRIRNELFGLRLQEVLNQLRRLEDTDQDIIVQLDQFELNKTYDDEQLPGIKGVDLNSPLEVFYAINKQVADTPQEIHFLTLLQHLLKIDQNDANSDLIWQTVEKLACRATLVESAEDSQKLILSSQRKRERSTDGKCTCSCHDCDKQRVTSPRRNNSTSVASSPTTKVAPPAPPPVPTPPPPPPPMGGPPPPPGAPPPPPGMGPFAGSKPASAKLPQQNVPKAKNKMRTLQWQKIPVDKIVTGKPNIWTMAGKRFNGYVSKMDYDAIEELFSVSKPQTSSSVIKGSSSQNPLEKKRKEQTEINLLDGKRSLNVNIFLKQFRMSNEEIVDQLRTGESQKLGLEKLKGLMKILPDQDELEMFKSFQGDKDKLGSAEKFFVCLFTLPNYAIRIDGLLIKEEFRTAMEWIRPSIDSVIEAAKDIKENKELHELLYLVLIAGNYLNSGNYAGDAAGFKLSSLIKLTEIRANKPRMNLLHYVVMQAEEKNPRLLQFPEDMKFLKDASQVSMENLVNDIANLNKKYTRISEHIGTVGKDFQNQMSTFLKGAKEELAELEEDLKDIDSLRLELADFFCEDPQTFKMEESFRTLQTFCERFSKAISENEQRRKQEARVEAKRKQREAEAKKTAVEEIKSPEGQTMDRGINEEGSIVDLLLADVRSGFANRKFGESNFTVQKVQKVNLDANENIKNNASKSGDGQFFDRMGYGRRSMRRRKLESDLANGLDSVDSESTCSSIETCSSLEDSVEYANQARTRKSYAIYSEDKLFDILMTPGENQDSNNNNEGKFERYGSLRRRRQERREKRNILDVYDRERAPSPAVDDGKSNISDVRRSRTPSSNERPLSGHFEEEKTPSSSIRRSRSMHDRPLSASAKSDESLLNETDNMAKAKQRINEQKNNGMPNENSNVNKTQSDNLKSVQKEEPTDARSSSKWRSNINSADVQKILQTIDEKSRLETPTRELLQNEQNSKAESVQESLERSRDLMARRVSRNSLDPNELKKMLEDVDSSQQSTNEDDKNDETDGHKVSVSVKTKLNRRWHSDLGKNEIDKVLKDIEDSESNPADSTNKPDQEEALKKRREKRKQRETLSIDDVHAALKEIRTNQDSDVKPESVVAHTVTTTAVTNVPKSPAIPPRRSRSNSEGNEESNTPEKEAKPKKDRDSANMSKAAKLAAKRRFRHERFGDKEKAILNSSDGRWKSDVHREEVDQALKDMAKGGMSRSKSYDESVARKALGESGEFSLAGNKDASDKRSFRNSLGRLSSGDSRRNGIYMPSSDSETEVPSEGMMSPRRSSSTKSDSPKSSSRLSIKSTSTSTETLRCETPYSDGEVSPEQKRRNSAGKKQEQLGTVEITDGINDDYDNPPTAPPRIKRSNSLLEKSEIHLSSDKDDIMGETDETPMALIAKWRTRRDKNRRISYYDNVSDQENPASPRNKNDSFNYDTHLNSPRLNTHSGLTIIHKSEGSGDSYRNDIGSRCSYASSSDSARDEGFETMSGTVSQRTSLSSTLESELTPSFTRKTEGLKILHSDKTTFADDIIPPKQEIVVSHAHKQSEIDARKQRTESWTEAVVANTNLKDTSLDSSMEYAATSPDSGHCTSKEDVWSENMDLESTIRCKTPSSEENVGSPINKAPLALPENTKTIGGKKKSVPSYMRGTASSSTKTSKTGSDSNQRRSTLSANTTPNRPQSRNSSRISTNLNKSMTESNTSIVSSVSATSEASTTSHNKTNVKRRPSANYGRTPNSRSTTPNPVSRPTTPHVPTSRPASRNARESVKASPSTPVTKSSSSTPITTTPLASRGFTRTQSLRLPSTTARETVERLAKNTSTERSKSRPSFMSPTAASKAKDDQPPPTPPPRTTSANSTPKSATKTPSISVTPPPQGSTESKLGKKTPAPSPLTRSASLRLPSRSTGRLSGRESPLSDKDKTQSDSKVKSFMSKLGGNKVKPESPTKKLPTVAEQASSQECLDSAEGKDKSSSLIKKIVNKTKDIKSPGKKSSETVKTETDKRKPKK